VQPALALVLGFERGAQIHRFIHGPTGIHAMQDDAGDWTWAVQDALGSVRSEVDDTLAVQASRKFAPYLPPFDEQGTFVMPFGATGEMTDDNELVYLRARYLNPGLGVFASLDPVEGVIQRAMSLNGYSWVEGDVANTTDPSGMIGETPGQWDICAGILQGIDCSCWERAGFSVRVRNNMCQIRVFFQWLPVPPCRSLATPTPTPEEQYAIWSQEVVTFVRQLPELACLSEVVEREVVGTSPPDYLGSGIFGQARAITWAVLNNLALTKNLDAGLRHGNNDSIIYCHVDDVSPCPMGSSFVPQNPEVQRGINSALSEFGYRTAADPTGGSLQWRHVPNDGWPGFEENQVQRQVLENGRYELATTFYNRHIEAVSRFQAENTGRIYFPPQVTSAAEAEQYSNILSTLGTLAVFDRNTPVSGSNIYDVLEFPQAGYLQEPRDSCAGRN
jgi:RHS repeat-associated protein